MVPGLGDADNGAFRVSGDQLVTAVPLDYELKSSYSIRVQTTDQGGLSFERPLTVQVLEVNEAPRVVSPIPNQTAPANRQLRFTLAQDAFVDPDVGQSLSYAAARADGSALPQWLKFDAQQRTFSGRPLVRDVGEIRVRVTATDSGSFPLAGLSVRLTKRFGRGFSVQSLWNFRELFLTYRGRTPRILCTAWRESDGEPFNAAILSTAWREFAPLDQTAEIRSPVCSELAVRGHTATAPVVQQGESGNYYDREVKGPDDNPTLGLILCTEKNEAAVRYILGEGQEQIFASR